MPRPPVIIDANFVRESRLQGDNWTRIIEGLHVSRHAFYEWMNSTEFADPVRSIYGIELRQVIAEYLGVEYKC